MRGDVRDMTKGNTRTQKTLSTLRDMGYLPGIVEKWIQATMQRKDLFGILDIVAIAPDITLGVQSTSVGQMSAHRKTLRESEHSLNWMTGPRELILVGWEQKSGYRGKWTARWEIAIANADGDIDFRPITPEEVATLTAYAE